MELGLQIKLIREEKHISQARLAAACFLSRTSITNIEKGRQHIPLHTLYIVANALEIPVTELLPDSKDLNERYGMENMPDGLLPVESKWIREIALSARKGEK